MAERHPDELTPREREVLALLRHGLTNEEIAERLGITLDGAKYHVSQILAKLGVATRDEAAAAAATKPPVRAPQRRRWWAAWPLAAKAAGAAFAVAAVVGLGVLAWGVWESDSQADGDQPSAVLLQTPVPWIDATPGPTSSPSPFPTRNPVDLAVSACQARNVNGEVNGGNGAGGWIFVYLAFSNVGSEPCRLEGVPDIQFLGSDGQALLTDWRRDPCLPTGALPCQQLVAILTPDAGQTPVPNYFIRPGQASLTLMYWGRLEDDPSYTPCAALASAIAVDLPENGGRMVVPLNGPTNACISPGVSQFAPAPATPQSADRAGRLLKARLNLPQSVVSGSTLRYVAELSNPSTTEAFEFGDLCPEYIAILGTKEAHERHMLNCRAAPSIPPGGTVAFAMELAIPAEVRPGSYPIDWTLDGTTYQVFLGAHQAAEKTPYTVTVLPEE